MVCARAALQNVVAVAAIEDVVAATAEQDIVTLVPEHAVVAIGHAAGRVDAVGEPGSENGCHGRLPA